jgi:hypothetical protein
VSAVSLQDWRYAAMAFGGGAIVFFLHRAVEEIPGSLIMVLDAAGLAMFAIAGTQKALLHRDNARRVVGAGADGIARGSLCNGGGLGFNLHGKLPKVASTSNLVGRIGRNGLFSVAGDQCVATLEFAGSNAPLG